MTLARRLGIRQLLPVPIAAACSTGLYALLAAADLLEAETTTHGLAGASDACLTPLMLAGFAAMGVLCGEHAPGQGHGFAPAEGAGFAALSNLGPWRLLAGVRLGDASHETQFRDPQTLESCLAALWQVLPNPQLIVVHGTGTAIGDTYEQRGLAAGPWSAAARLHCKPVIGHCLGASGLTELVLALEAPVERLWKISLGFGGHLAAVAVARA
jgi:3-oxoacyl-(acyl-carrier-protein) synthase